MELLPHFERIFADRTSACGVYGVNTGVKLLVVGGLKYHGLGVCDQACVGLVSKFAHFLLPKLCGCRTLARCSWGLMLLLNPEVDYEFKTLGEGGAVESSSWQVVSTVAEYLSSRLSCICRRASSASSQQQSEFEKA